MIKFIDLPPRPFVRNGKVFDYKTGCGSIFITVTVDEDGVPYEVFITKGASGNCMQGYSEALGKMISMALRCHINPEEIIKLLTGINCGEGGRQHGERITSCPSAVSLALKRVMSPPEIKKDELSNEEIAKRTEELRKEREKLG